jgi:hypothetical protein
VAGEFQHRNDANMLARMRRYLARQEAHYRHQGIVRDGEHPPALPLVIHTGPDRWTAEDGFEVYRALPAPAGARLAPCQRAGYILVDAGRHSTLSVPPDNRLGPVVRLTAAASEEELAARLAEEWQRFGGPRNAAYRRGMLAWAEEVALGLGRSGVRLPSFEELEQAMEEGTMGYLLEDSVKEWQTRWVDKGREEGREEGREGERRNLERLAERRFGAAAAQRLSSTLNGTPSRRTLDEAGDLIVGCRTAQEFVDRLGDQ